MNFLKSIALFTITLLFVACSDDDGNAPLDPNNGSSADQTTQNVQGSDWRVTQFVDSGNNETSDFTGYVFTFNTDGTVIATNGTLTVNGTWSVTDSNSSSDDDGNSTDDDDFNLFFAVDESSDFEDLNDDWDFISSSATKIELIDISGGNGGTDYLTFEKI